MLYSKFDKRLKWLKDNDLAGLFAKNKIGIEKESLRVTPSGSLAQTAHPKALGSSLTHPYITTDYSEALLELITPPLEGIDEVLHFLHDTHCYVYQNINNEILWATSMPCILSGSTSIPLAQYGTSNSGKMKTVYREGLGLRYGREMQVIAGVHFNFSLSDEFWAVFHQHENSSENIQDFISDNYFKLIRNLQRYGWLIPYLFGSSPAVCKSFLQYEHDTLDSFDESTYYEPYATSLRMGDIGYQNNKENEIGVKADYSNLDAYVDSLKYAINTEHKPYTKLGVKKPSPYNDEYQQLNANILQIENEYYSTVRPKQILHKNESPSISLKKRGVKYVELRSLDVNVYDPAGINASQLYFLEAFLIFCLLNDSPVIDAEERIEIDNNEMITAHKGRENNLNLRRRGDEIKLTTWAKELSDKIMGLAELLDGKASTKPVNKEVIDEPSGNNTMATKTGTTQYVDSIIEQLDKIENSELTPSAIILAEMRENKESFHQFAYRKSKLNQHFFKQQEISANQQSEYIDLMLKSLQEQTNIESTEQQTFEEYLQSYLKQNNIDD